MIDPKTLFKVEAYEADLIWDVVEMMEWMPDFLWTPELTEKTAELCYLIDLHDDFIPKRCVNILNRFSDPEYDFSHYRKSLKEIVIVLNLDYPMKMTPSEALSMARVAMMLNLDFYEMREEIQTQWILEKC